MGAAGHDFQRLMELAADKSGINISKDDLPHINRIQDSYFSDLTNLIDDTYDDYFFLNFKQYYFLYSISFFYFFF